MPIPATDNTIAETYDRIKRRLKTLKAMAPMIVAELSTSTSPLRVKTIADILADSLRDCPSSSGFPQVWVDALKTYADSQTLSPEPDWVAAYESAVDVIAAARTAALAAIPVTVDGYLRQYVVSPDGGLTEATVSVPALADLRSAWEAIDSAIG